MPRSKTKRERLAQVFRQDALTPRRAAWTTDAPARIREIEAVALLWPWPCCGRSFAWLRGG
ncbi:hypothetical protein [Streptomyces sp. NBC_00872]|uniref:hypothetical protein n=1 Tax=Streptomyces sp. NBC_00872 TaxID=2903686 RepID=UPI0038681DF2|nr:hypothetical protein OG214_05610 [Streptomyces sp. NBC_00872]